MLLLVCTGKDLIRLERAADGWTARTALEGMGVRCVAARGSRVLVGASEPGVLLSEDGGATWTEARLPEDDVFSVAISAADGALYAGTEPSRLFVSRNGGAWTELEALQDIPSRERWSFPPRPWTHHVRWIAPDPHRAERLLIGIELGGVMYSEDGGATFSDHRPGAKLDAHNLAWHPLVEGRAYESAGDGAAWSHDGGRSWEPADAGRDLGYCWALAVDPEDPDRWWISAATGPRAAHSGTSARGALYRWDGAWTPLSPPGESMPYSLVASDGELIAGMADGRILHSRDGGVAWQDAGVRLDGVLAMASL